MPDEGDTRRVEAKEGQRDRSCGNQHGMSGGGHGGSRCVHRVGAVRHELAISGAEEEAVVDADAQADHQRQRGSGGAEGHHRGRRYQQAQGGGDGNQGASQRDDGPEHAAEADQQNEQRDGDPDHLGERVVRGGAEKFVEAAAVVDGQTGLSSGCGCRFQFLDVVVAQELGALVEVDRSSRRFSRRRESCPEPLSRGSDADLTWGSFRSSPTTCSIWLLLEVSVPEGVWKTTCPANPAAALSCISSS